MKTCAHLHPTVIFILFLFVAAAAPATTFFSDTFIDAADTSYDGEDIVVTNCTLTVDGTHGFNSVQILNGGVLTHSPNTYGPQQLTFFVSAEPQVMSTTNLATLDNTNVDTSSILVMNTSGTIVYTEDVDYTVTASNQFVQLELTTNSSIADGATVLVNYEWFQTFEGFNLTINNYVLVATGGAIDLSGQGYSGGIGFGIGAGTSQSTNFPFTYTAGSGAGHGGCGAVSSTFARGGAAYDSTTNPGILGSGGGTGGSNPGGSGGGVGQLTIGGTLEIDGVIRADGLTATNAHSGGGAGGSLLVSAESISGAGTISANGGGGETPDGGGGGGGRIAVYFATNNFSGNISAVGGSGANYGGAGTIYLRAFGESAGELTIANSGPRGTNTFFSPLSISNLSVSGGAVAQAQILTFAVSNLFVGSNSALVTADSSPLTVTVNGTATIETNATITADFRSLSGSGNGGTSCTAGSGGGYGGLGGGTVCGRVGGSVYGSIIQPLSAGSAGGGPTTLARGGGLINLTVAGTLALGGTISADGAPSTARADGGGGSGGGILLKVGTLSGTGTISASGGAANNLAGGGGGGGRVAVYYSTDLFTGDILAVGGAGMNNGGAGTIYLQGGTIPLSQLIIDNGGLVGPTVLPSSLNSLVSSETLSLIISGAAVLTNFDGSFVTLSSLFIGSNSLLAANSSPLEVSAANVTIQSGGGIRSDGTSLGSAGSGQTLLLSGGGGGNGGYGAMSASNALGGGASGSITSPETAGGNGGAGSDGPGGIGGGFIDLAVRGTLQLDGGISANGLTGPGFNSGGGAGGSVLMNVGTLAGSGTISAIGGSANNLGGGGGGGHIAVAFETNLFAGTVTAPGGAGANYGGAGTVYLATTLFFEQAGYPQLIVNNGGTTGADTPLSTTQFPAAPNALNLTVSGGAVLSNAFTQTLSLENLFVGSNSAFLAAGSFPQQVGLSIVTNATIQNGGVLSVDGASTTLSGQSLNSTGGGGGYGGMGGASLSNAPGGNGFNDSVTLPEESGGRGGAGLNGASGGNGGGGLRITVGGTLQLDGVISANGLAGPAIDSGGGSGGSLSLSVGKVFGAGVISANGGAGNGVGGGGGGGRIALTYSSSNGFAGSLSAHGGAGANFGGAGTIFVASSQFLVSRLVLDNGGVRGANTPIFNYPAAETPFDLIITNGATLVDTNGESFEVRNLLIGSNSAYVPNPGILKLITVQTNLIVFAGGSINGDGQSTSGQDPGQTLDATGGGGGHAGYGGSSISNAPGGGVTTDQFTEPQAFGSRGGAGFNEGAGGNGGSALHLTVDNLLRVDGTISANGVSGAAGSGAGSGGSIWVSTTTFAGAGTISANGGSADSVGGGGGGGRIAITRRTNSFSGTLTARGGAGARYGGAGTIYTAGSPQYPTTSPAQLIVDNGGNRGTNTLIEEGQGQNVNLVIGSGASVALGAQLTFISLTISSNATLGAAQAANTPQGSIEFLDIISNATIQPGGAIMLDGEGYAANFGPGSGAVASGTGSGGGHGAYGSASQAVPGGSSYDSITSPEQLGSGGGSGTTPTTGSTGGGLMQLTVGGTLAVNGTISADGESGIASGAGGGAGGALNLHVGTLSGSGTVSANGGAGEFFGGGGGGAGGRIAVTFSSNQFTGTISADGGAGFQLSGGAGTIYLKTNSISTAAVILDNGGNPGTNTSINGLAPPVALSVANGAVATSTGGQFQSLFIGNGGEFVASPKTQLNLNVLGNALVDSGGSIIADFLGYDDNTGPGAGSIDLLGNGSGGGYGGAGGMSIAGAPGGLPYGSSNELLTLGSPGGVSPALPGFSQGGGAIRLTVSGTLTVNGNISANGNDGLYEGWGGGSGGSIWVTAQSLSGNGSLTANGGVGQDTDGGSGGGGRIAIYAVSNSFSGSVAANGGAAGAAPGHNGTIYIGTDLVVSGSVTDTNGDAIAGITLSGTGTTPALSDANGLYSISVPLFWSGTVTPSGSGIIIPSSQSYSVLSSNAPNQNFVITSPSGFSLCCGQCDGTNMLLSWYGINGASYQPLCSTDLVNWVPYGGPLPGNNGPVNITFPLTNAPQLFFRLGVTY